MTKYFNKECLAQATQALKNVKGKWVIVSLVLAANGVRQNPIVKLNKPDQFLDKFFSGTLIGLTPAETGKVTIRPAFADVETEPGDLAASGRAKLWANIYSRNGYKEFVDQGILIPGERVGEFRLSPQYRTRFRQEVPATFRLENLLVWLYAFTGFDNAVNSWADLYANFLATYVAGGALQPDYSDVLKLSDGVPWPADKIAEVRPTDEELQELLLPSRFVQGVKATDWLDIRHSLEQLMEERYQGMQEAERLEISANVISALVSTKRLFILGEPGAGKSTLAKFIADAFEDVFEKRLLIVNCPVTDRTTPDKLLGYCNINGDWVDGALTVPQASGRQLLYKDLADTTHRNQINLIILDEANRRDIESLLARLQISLDSENADPNSRDHAIALDNAGVRFLSPFTYIVMTGNSPKDDSGRLVQSRPFKRRPNLLVMPNAFEAILLSDSIEKFRTELLKHWNESASLSLVISNEQKQVIAAAIVATAKAVPLREVLRILHQYSVGITFGLIRKLLRTAATEVSMGLDFDSAIDTGLASAVGLLLSTESIRNGRSLKDALLEIQQTQRPHFPRMYAMVDHIVDTTNEFGSVRAFF